MDVRLATVDDAAACAAIYAPYVTSTCISFESVPPTVDEMAGRIARALVAHAWLVALDPAGTVVGYAYGGPFAGREAYRWSCEVSVYVRQGVRRTGTGRALYDALLESLAGRGYRRVFAGIALPNEASEALHRALGFTPAAVYRRVGWKQGRWHDVAWLQRSLGPGPEDAPPAPLV